MHAVLLMVWLLACGSAPPSAQLKTPPGSTDWPEATSDAVRAAMDAEVGPPRTRHLTPEGHPIYTNRLILESSPYLRQHAHNPVDWMPWGDEAFARAAAENKPILLSVGYSTCHWCHVMEEESFEDPEIARRINANFIAIKVDREERPDVDAVYMKAVQSLIGRGGWPMTVVMRPDKVPFFAATYLPARTGDRGSRKGFYEVLGDLSGRWVSDRDNLDEVAAEVSRRMARLAKAPDPTGAPGLEALQTATAKFEVTFDRQRGGFGKAPKFPQPSELVFLLREHRRTGEAAPRDMALDTLDAMDHGGLRDHLAGGFHRYTIDANWTVPHFEKMLYDQSQLALVHLDAYQITGDERYRDVARETLDYVLREMRDPAGGFHTAQDADSLNPAGEREEGAFYTWTPSEITDVLGPDDAPLAMAWYGVGIEGNLEGRTVLSARKTPSQVAAQLGRPADTIDADLLRIRKALFQARKKRPAPPQDDKVVLAWNALMISALARASFVLDEPAYAESARVASRFITRQMSGPEGALHRTWRDGDKGHPAVLEDYALFAQAMLDLFEATGEGDWIHLAKLTTEQMDARFGDPEGGWYETDKGAESLMVRAKPWADGAMPSGNAVAIGVHLRLHQLTGDDSHREKADAAFSLFGSKLERNGPSTGLMLSWLGFRLGEPRQVVLVGGKNTEPLREVLRNTFIPTKVVVQIPEGVEFSLASLPLTKGKIALGGDATAYVCREGLCEAPTSDPAVLRKQLLVRGSATPDQ